MPSTPVNTMNDVDWKQCPIGTMCHERLSDHKGDFRDHTEDMIQAIAINNTSLGWVVKIGGSILVGMLAFGGYMMDRTDENAKAIVAINNMHLETSAEIKTHIAVIRQILEDGKK